VSITCRRNVAFYVLCYILHDENTRDDTMKNADRSAQLSPSPCAVLYTNVGGRCDQLVTDDRHQFTTLTVPLSLQHLRQSAVPMMWLVPTKI